MVGACKYLVHVLCFVVMVSGIILSPLYSTDHICWVVSFYHHCILTIASFPGPAQLFIAIIGEKWAWYLFLREWRQDRKDGRKGLIVCGYKGPRTAKRDNVEGNLSSRGRLSCTPSVEHVASWTVRETQPVSSENFRHFPITSCSREKRYLALHAFPY